MRERLEHQPAIERAASRSFAIGDLIDLAASSSGRNTAFSATASGPSGRSARAIRRRASACRLAESTASAKSAFVGAEVLRVPDVGLHHHRNPGVDRRFEPHAGEPRRRDADDGEVHAVEASRRGRSTSAAASKRRRQKASLITATGCPPSVRLSSGVSKRPSCGASRSTPKNSPETNCTAALCGSPSAVERACARRGSSPPDRQASGNRRAAARRTDTRRAA